MYRHNAPWMKMRKIHLFLSIKEGLCWIVWYYLKVHRFYISDPKVSELKLIKTVTTSSFIHLNSKSVLWVAYFAWNSSPFYRSVHLLWFWFIAGNTGVEVHSFYITIVTIMLCMQLLTCKTKWFILSCTIGKFTMRVGTQRQFAPPVATWLTF